MTTKTTPFTIALWDSFPADKKPKAVTKSNRLVRILCTDRLGDYPIIGLIENRMPESWDPATSDLFLLIPSFPPSPDGQTWWNPANLTPEQVGEGWRLMLPDEPKPKGYQFWERCACFSDGYAHEIGRPANYHDYCTYRVPISTPFPDGSVLQPDGTYLKPAVKEKKLIPWAPQEAIGRVVRRKGTENLYQITEYSIEVTGPGRFLVGSHWLSPQDLLEIGERLDGSPCGTEVEG